MCLRACKGNSGALPPAMREMDNVEGRHAAMHNDKTREPLVLFGRESTVRCKAVVTRHESSSRGDQIRVGNEETGIVNTTELGTTSMPKRTGLGNKCS